MSLIIMRIRDLMNSKPVFLFFYSTGGNKTDRQFEAVEIL